MDSTATEIICILDCSGSMVTMGPEAKNGFNKFLAKQKELPGKAVFTLVMFDHEYELKVCRRDIKEVKPLGTYPLGGSTALLDAVGKTMVDAERRLKEIPEDLRPAKTLVMILTDGQENASQEFTKKSVKQIIENRQNELAWEFVFLGANQDSFSEAGGVGIGFANASNFGNTGTGVLRAFATMNLAASDYRSKGKLLRSATYYYDSTEKEEEE